MNKGKTFTFDVGQAYSLGVENVEIIGNVAYVEEDAVILTGAHEFSRTYGHLRQLGTIPVLREEVRWIKYA